MGRGVSCAESGVISFSFSFSFSFVPDPNPDPIACMFELVPNAKPRGDEGGSELSSMSGRIGTTPPPCTRIYVFLSIPPFPGTSPGTRGTDMMSNGTVESVEEKLHSVGVGAQSRSILRRIAGSTMGLRGSSGGCDGR